MSNDKLKIERARLFFESILNILQLIFNSAASIAFLGMVATVLYQIIGRSEYIKSAIWTEEVSRYLFIYVVVLASVGTLASGRHIKLETFHEKLSLKTKLIFNIICYVLLIVFCAMLLQYCWNYTINGNRQTSPALGIRMSWIYGSTLVFFILTALTSLLLMVRDLLLIFEKGRAV